MTDVVLDDAFWRDVEPGTEALMDRWLATEGQHVAAGEVIANVVLVKTTLDVVAPASGTLERVLVPAEQTFSRGKPLAVVRSD